MRFGHEICLIPDTGRLQAANHIRSSAMDSSLKTLFRHVGTEHERRCCHTPEPHIQGSLAVRFEYFLMNVGSQGEVRVIANWFPLSEKGRSYGYFATTWAVAPAIVPIVITWMAATFFVEAWRPVFFVPTIPGLLGIFDFLDKILLFHGGSIRRRILRVKRILATEYEVRYR
jgi:hypothetical protein